MSVDYPIRERFPRMQRWMPAPPLAFGWAMKTPATARTAMRVLPTRQIELTISHDTLKGVTPRMLSWWFSHIDSEMEYQGQTHPRYRVWHPRDHIQYRDLSHAPDGSGSAGTRRHIVEAFGADRRFLVNIIDRVVHLDETGILLSTEQAGISLGYGSALVPVPLTFASLQHWFTAVPEGTRYRSRLLIGLESALGRYLVNPVIRPLIIGDEMARAWLKHNVEEVGNFEFFLPALYRQVND